MHVKEVYKPFNKVNAMKIKQDSDNSLSSLNPALCVSFHFCTRRPSISQDEALCSH